LTETAALPPSFWRERLSPYTKPSVRRGILDIVTSAVAYVVVVAAMYALVHVSVIFVLVLSVPAAGFAVRTFIVFHDCTHGSFLPSRKANHWVGIACALLVFTPFHSWRHEHAIHHATAGDLDRRGRGDLETLTAREYLALSWSGRLGYRLMRNPFVMFVIGPVWALMLEPRLVPSWARKRFWRQIVATDIALVLMVGGLCAAFGWRTVLLVQLPSAMLAGAVGIWLFYVQHQFDGVYWTHKDGWTHQDSALLGSSYLKLPKVLQFFTGNIGFHHVHHMNPRIPNYNLPRAHNDIPLFHDVPTMSLWDGIRTLRLKVYDERQGRLVSFAAARG
jgi:omega-6 fatty acid desaturase (delta-12 desaturase)